MRGGIFRVPRALVRIATGILLCCFVHTALFTQPVTPEDFLERARDHYERRRFLNALDSLRIVLQMTEDRDARTYRTKFEAEILTADSLKSMGRIDEAANMYERSLVHGYEEKGVHAFLATYFDKHSRYNQALEHYQKYYALDKSDVETHMRYGALLGRLNRRDEAKQILEGIEVRSVAQKSEDCERLEAQRKLRDALRCFKTMRQARPEREQNYLGVYRTALALKEYAQLQESAEWLYYIFGSEARYVWPLVELKITQRKFYAARLLLEEIIRLRGKDSDAERLLENLRVQAGPALDKPFRATNKEMQMLGPILKAQPQ